MRNWRSENSLNYCSSEIHEEKTPEKMILTWFRRIMFSRFYASFAGGVMQGFQLLDRFDHNSREGLHGPVTVGAHPNAFRKVQLLDFDPIIVGQIRRQPQWEPSNIHGS